jgi:hypothetical protein
MQFKPTDQVCNFYCWLLRMRLFQHCMHGHTCFQLICECDSKR